ncbi:MAG: hypothetical protein OQK09_03800 [Colwellia sp.]|nr:hypothetical protein [Colwellia sp.]MCW8866467.1 hypothetical protein [Colwellia sp.]MCW9080611.1 hypothetical protein [Colwellia sp.]
MRKLLTSPVNIMALSDAESSIYNKSLSFISELSLNLMAVKVTHHPKDFLGWCTELLSLCQNGINRDLLETNQFKPLEKLEQLLALGISVSQLKMLRIAPWSLFVGFIEQQAESHALEERFALLNYIKQLNGCSLSDMSESDRLAYAGKHTNNHHYTQYDFDVEWFASTKGAKVFHTLLAENPESFYRALDNIPLTGDVTPEQYRAFTSAYKAIFTNYTKNNTDGEKAPLAPATRLLAMRRPDQFIALTNAKLEVICQGLGLVKFTGFDFDSYWQELVATIRTCAWWHQTEPRNENERKIWQARVILIDLFLFSAQDLAANSNYIRLRDKALNKPVRSSSLTKRSSVKLTIEEQVERALAAEGIPEYLKEKRESIINGVKKGKSPEQVITLMRAIFG